MKIKATRIISVFIIAVALITTLLFASGKVSLLNDFFRETPDIADTPRSLNLDSIQEKLDESVVKENLNKDSVSAGIIKESTEQTSIVEEGVFDEAIVKESVIKESPVSESTEQEATEIEATETIEQETTEQESSILPEFFKPDIVPSIVNGEKKPKTRIEELVFGAVEQYGVTNSYNGAYKKLAYPNGDVDISTGVCTDVVIRAFRSINIDLQKNIHRDMSRHFRKYPRNWGLKSTDRNIDHRRVPNMETYFTRKGYKIPIGKSTDREHYLPGDLVVWRISGKLTHIGIVSDEIVPDTSRYFIIHNPLQGVEISDWLDGGFEIINHFRLSK